MADIIKLNSSTQVWSNGPNEGLPAHAFASMALSHDRSQLTVVGGVTASCADDDITHTLDLSSQTWSSATPEGFVRRHGSGAATIGNGSAKGMLLVVAGLNDKFVCSRTSSAYTAADTIALPASDHRASSNKMDSSLTGDHLAISDFAMAQTKDETVYLAGGQAADGSLVDYSTIAVWNKQGGWSSQKVSGDIPAGRLGATLVAHPTQNVLILHGGSTEDGGKFSPTNLVSVLDMKSWKWSAPSHLQPAASTARSYHTAVMTPSGVMITSFGMSLDGAPSDNQAYLDMRSKDQKAWGWQSDWSSNYLTNELAASSESGAHSKSDKGTIAAAVVPTVICVLILIPLLVYFIRRHRKRQRQRRLASHYSFSAQEDRGDFNNNRNRWGWGHSRADDEDSHPSFVSSMRDVVYNVFRRGSNHGVGDDGTINEPQQDMTQVRNPNELTQHGQPWEEIDFGLGRVDRVDHGRREANYTDLPARIPRGQGSRRVSGNVIPDVYPMPIASTMPYGPDIPDSVRESMENPFDDPKELNDEQIDERIHTASTAVQETPQLVDLSPRLGTPKDDGQKTLVTPGSVAAAQDASEWAALEASLVNRPVFQSISPTSTLRSHAHETEATREERNSTHSHTSRDSFVSPPSLPPLQFSQSPLSPSRKVSGASVQYPSINQGNMRQLAGHVRRESMESAHIGTLPRNALGLARLQQGSRDSVSSRLHIANPSSSLEDVRNL